jgi:S-adenosylmethionine hydrolase
VEVVHVDRYGNLVTVASERFLREEFGEEWRAIGVRVGGEQVRGIRLGYVEGSPGELMLSIGGAGTVEISVRGGSARGKTGVKPGDPVELLPPPR